VTTTFSDSARVVRGGLVLLDLDSAAIRTVIALQYNPETVSRTLQVQAVGGEGGERSEALRLKGPPVETYKLDAEIDGADQLEAGDPLAAEHGIQPQLAALETIVYPSSASLQASDALARSGTLEIAPLQAPLTLLVWSRNRIVPVRITDFSITEEAFDAALNPIRAKVSLGLRVLSVADLGFDHRGGSLFLAYQQQKERLAGLAASATLGSLGIGEIG
jgi:hypothetical protein